MKIRQGFVSNSSSSSFVVVFDRPELDIEYLKERLYNNAPSISYEYNWGNEYQWFHTEQLCQAIIDEMKPITTREQLIEALEGMSHYDDSRFPDWPGWDEDKEVQERQWSEYDAKMRQVREQMADEFLSKINEGEHIFVGTFSDNDGSMFTQLEHGGTFSAIPKKIRISHH